MHSYVRTLQKLIFTAHVLVYIYLVATNITYIEKLTFHKCTFVLPVVLELHITFFFISGITTILFLQPC